MFILDLAYDYPSLLNPVNSSQWTANGSSNVMTTNLYTSTNSTSSGSEIFGPFVPGPSGSYEVRTTLPIPSNASSGSYLTNGGACQAQPQGILIQRSSHDWVLIQF